MGQLRRLINRLMDLARRDNAVQTALSSTIPPSINLERIVRESVAMVLPLAEKQGRTIVIEAPDAVPFHGNADDLRDMVDNLLDNALVHGSGTVRVAVRHEARNRSQTVLIEVAD